MRGIDFDTIGEKVDELKGVNPKLLRAEVERHCRYLEPAKK